MDADILRVTKQGKGMHKRQALRLLLAAPRGNYTSAADDDLTQTEAVNLLNALILGDSKNRLKDAREKNVKDAADGPNEKTGASAGAGGSEIDLSAGEEATYRGKPI